MAAGKGKQFEQRFKLDWEECFGLNTIDRIYDTTNGFKGVANISDFIAYVHPFIYFLECKSTTSNTFSIPYRQHPKLLKKVGLRGVFAGLVIWFIEQEKIAFVSTKEVERLISLGYKSINCNKMVGKEGFEVIEIPTTLKRTFLKSDLQILYKYMEERNKGE